METKLVISMCAIYHAICVRKFLSKHISKLACASYGSVLNTYVPLVCGYEEGLQKENAIKIKFVYF